MTPVSVVQEHPFALAGFILAALYFWSIRRNRLQSTRLGNVKRHFRTFAPSAIVLILVIAAGFGLRSSFARVDFGMFYSTALLFKQDRGHLYDQQVQAEYLRAVTGLEGKAHYLPFAYPPIVALLFAPLTLFSFKSAYFVMLLINVLLLILTFWWLPTKLEYRPDQRVTLWVTASAVLPLYAVLVLGNLTFLELLLLSLFVVDFMEGREGRAAIWTGFLLFRLTLFPVPFLILLWKKKWNAIGIFMLVAAGMFLFSLFLVGWSGVRANAAMLFLMTGDSLLPKMQSLRGLVFSMGMGTGTWVLLVMATLAALWTAVLRASDRRWVLAASMIAVLLVAPYLQFYDLSIGLIALAIALTTMDSVTDKIRNYLFFLAFVPGVLLLALQRNGLVIPVMPVVLLFCFIYCLWRAFQNKAQSLR